MTICTISKIKKNTFNRLMSQIIIKLIKINKIAFKTVLELKIIIIKKNLNLIYNIINAIIPIECN